jgi:hypothetical protein
VLLLTRLVFVVQTQPVIFETPGGDDLGEVEVGQIPSSLSRVRFFNVFDRRRRKLSFFLRSGSIFRDSGIRNR